MRTVYERCAGLDVHKRNVVVCVLRPGGCETRRYGTMTAQLLELLDWLLSEGCTHVAMESTGSYWKPIYNLLESADLEVLLVNSRHFKTVPGRKTDVKDAEWLAELLSHGLLRGSYVPNREQRELRELVRYRRRLVQERSQEACRLQKVLEGANIKLGSVASNVLGKSGRAMLKALVEGEQDPTELASLALGRLRKKQNDLRLALDGCMGSHQRFLLAEQLSHIEEIEARIQRVDQEVEARCRPFVADIDRLDTIPGVGVRIAEEVLAETGTDMTRFATHRHLASWARICPSRHQSDGKSKSSAIGPGNNWLRTSLVEAAQAAARTKGTYLHAQYQRIARRRGKKRATIAVAHTLLVIIYYLLKNQTQYHELGADFFDGLHHDAIVKNTRQRLEKLGYQVTLEPIAA